MKKLGILIVLIAFALPLFAQIGVKIQLNRRAYMLHENIFACVTLRNDSGKPLLFGSSPELQGFILFDIRDNRNRPVPPRKDRDIMVSGLYLSPGEIKRMVIRLNNHYDLSRNGNYTVYAYVSHNILPREYRSSDVSFSISPGVELWKKQVGLPDIAGTGSARNGERTYSILSLFESGFRNYYLKVEDEKHLLAITRIGNQVSYEKFQAEVDMLSRIHLLMPVAPRIFHYMSFNVNGVNLESSYWRTSGTIPMLYRDRKTGKVTRVGGVKARKGIDYRDPKEGRLSISQMLDERPAPVPAGKRDEGVVDLGEHVMPTKAADEK